MTTKENIIITRPKPEDLPLTLKQIARYAGGTRYRMDDEMKKLAASIMDKAKRLVFPALVYAVHDVSDLKKDIRDKLFSFGPSEDVSKVAACVCTLGPNLETEVNKMMKNGSALEGLFFYAAGVGLLESLANLSFAHITTLARNCDLYPGCRFGPGFNNIPMDFQAYLFSMVDSANIGVSLTDSMVMIPAKSWSFFVFLHKKAPPETNVNKCYRCSMETCPYRIVEVGASW